MKFMTCMHSHLTDIREGVRESKYERDLIPGWVGLRCADCGQIFEARNLSRWPESVLSAHAPEALDANLTTHCAFPPQVTLFRATITACNGRRHSALLYRCAGCGEVYDDLPSSGPSGRHRMPPISTDEALFMRRYGRGRTADAIERDEVHNYWHDTPKPQRDRIQQ